MSSSAGAGGTAVAIILCKARFQDVGFFVYEARSSAVATAQLVYLRNAKIYGMLISLRLRCVDLRIL